MIDTAIDQWKEVHYLEEIHERFQIRPGYILRQFMDEYLAIPVITTPGQQRSVSILNDVGEFIWRQMEGEGKTFPELLEAVLGEFETDAETASRDIAAFLSELKEKKFLLETEE